MDDYLFPSLSKITSTMQGPKPSGLTLQEEELWRIVDRLFYTYYRRELLGAFICNEQLVCAVYNKKNSNEQKNLAGQFTSM